MDEHDPNPEVSAPVWDPLATLPDEWRDLEVSGGRARILCRRWSGRERLVYEDAITAKLIAVADDGEEVVKLGSLRLFGASLTIRSSEGFPDQEDGRTFLSGTREQVEADLLAITDRDTFDEILRHARTVQPLPGQLDAAPDQAPAKGEDDDDSDPSPASSTGPEPTNDADADTGSHPA